MAEVAGSPRWGTNFLHGPHAHRMSFRSRLLLFFVIIVVVPMIAVALVLFSITADSETGKADAALAQGMRAAFAMYDSERASAQPLLRSVATDRVLANAVAAHDAARATERLSQVADRL